MNDPHLHRALDGSHDSELDSSYAWLRVAISVLIATLLGIGMWSPIVSLPAIQADFGIDRASAALPYTLAMFGFGLGGILMGRFADRFGIVAPIAFGAVALGAGYVAAALANSIWQVALAHGVLIGVGTSAGFGPLMADISHWFAKRRGLAVSLVAAGNYLAGTVWPPILESLIAQYGWRPAFLGVGLFCALTTLPLVLLIRRRRNAPTQSSAMAAAAAAAQRASGLSPNTLQIALIVAGISCCVAMSMPQVHIVAYCGDLGYGVARGAEMLSLMLAFGIVSRVVSGLIADRIGGVRTLLLGSCLQGVALVFYLFFDGLTSLYIISAMFGLFQGGIVPSYALIVREYFPPHEAGARVGFVIMATILGMALGGFLSGAIFDLTGSYRVAFMNGIAWNLLNVAIAIWLLMRPTGRLPYERKLQAGIAS